jgi:hypothetical protein
MARIIARRSSGRPSPDRAERGLVRPQDQKQAGATQARNPIEDIAWVCSASAGQQGEPAICGLRIRIIRGTRAIALRVGELLAAAHSSAHRVGATRRSAIQCRHCGAGCLVSGHRWISLCRADLRGSLFLSKSIEFGSDFGGQRFHIRPGCEGLKMLLSGYGVYRLGERVLRREYKISAYERT